MASAVSASSDVELEGFHRGSPAGVGWSQQPRPEPIARGGLEGEPSEEEETEGEERKRKPREMKREREKEAKGSGQQDEGDVTA